MNFLVDRARFRLTAWGSRRVVFEKSQTPQCPFGRTNSGRAWVEGGML